jgi:predicted deacylase
MKTLSLKLLTSMRRALVLAALLSMQNGIANEAADEQDDEPLPSDGSTPAAELRSAPAEDPSSTGDVQTDENSTDDGVSLADAVTAAAEKHESSGSLQLLKAHIPPGTFQRLSWSATELFEGVPISTPVLVVNGRSPGPTLCLTAALHGDELNGIEMVRRVMHNLDPANLSGAVIGVPIVNLQGFRRGSRYLPDRRDLNRYFPGNENGSAASRIAYSFFNQIVANCDALVDLHTGSFERANLPQLRADLTNADIRTLTMGFGATVVLHSTPASGTLRAAATEAGIATVTLEAGGPSVLELEEVQHGVKGIETLLNTLGMQKKASFWGDPEPIFYRSTWVRANRGGILMSDVHLGATVKRGELLGVITDPMNNASAHVYSPFSGRIIGMARNQVVMPGFAAFHIGIETSDTPVDDGTDILSHDREKEAQINDYIDGMSE